MDAILLLMALRIGILVFMMGFTLRYKDWLGFAIVGIYLSMIVANTILELPYVTAFLGTPLVVAISWYIISCNRRRR